MGATLTLREGQRPYRADPLSEETVVVAWVEQLFGGDLRTSSGEKVQIVCRGWRSADAGPDFRDVIIAGEDGSLRRGDVEIHVKTSDWRRHGHSHDRRYNGVVLHVVMWDDENGRPTSLSSGAFAPVLALHSFLKVPFGVLLERARPERPPLAPCGQAVQRLGDRSVAGFLDRAGQSRMASKAAAFEAAIASRGAAQALYAGIFEALGYARNREPFRQLAELLPFASLEGLLLGRGRDKAIQRAEALLLGVAGMLPSQRGRATATDYASSELVTLEEEWTGLDGGFWMAADQWHFCGTRPENYPTRRIGGAARLIARSLDTGLVPFFLRPLDRPTAIEARHSLIGSLLVKGEPPVEHSPCRSGLIGRGRATVLAVNVILPFAVAYGNLSSHSGLANRARWTYFTFPPLPDDAIVRRMNRQLFGASSSNLVDSARRQQGLHHLYQELCRRGRCHDCELSASI
ncbi:MAG: DUF2851 family protein [Dehalococcoidia bacterium]|nr:DUF2851 family protein [Dehalococcoidia bacterium]